MRGKRWPAVAGVLAVAAGVGTWSMMSGGSAVVAASNGTGDLDVETEVLTFELPGRLDALTVGPEGDLLAVMGTRTTDGGAAWDLWRSADGADWHRLIEASAGWDEGYSGRPLVGGDTVWWYAAGSLWTADLRTGESASVEVPGDRSVGELTFAGPDSAAGYAFALGDELGGIWWTVDGGRTVSTLPAPMETPGTFPHLVDGEPAIVGWSADGSWQYWELRDGAWVATQLPTPGDAVGTRGFPTAAVRPDGTVVVSAIVSSAEDWEPIETYTWTRTGSSWDLQRSPLDRTPPVPLPEGGFAELQSTEGGSILRRGFDFQVRWPDGSTADASVLGDIGAWTVTPNAFVVVTRDPVGRDWGECACPDPQTIHIVPRG